MTIPNDHILVRNVNIKVGKKYQGIGPIYVGLIKDSGAVINQTL